MAFLYRRKRKGFSKHIAHGLVPAATVAPKPAVPRTPPPRSPSPSPERPRSALAAAILATALTGRTVALPQPHQRSLSGSDSICLEQEALEPYATVLGLRQGSDDGCDQSLAQSLEIPASNGEDEDIDACLPDLDREAESSPQSSEKKAESFSTNAIYSSPCKKKKEEFAPSPSTNADKEEVPFHETKELVDKSNMETEAEDQQIGLNLKEEKPPAQQWMCKKPPLSSDASIWVRQVRETKTKVKFREINQENWALHKALQAIAQELEAAKQQNAEQQLQLKTTEQENRRLKEDAEKAHRKEEATELLALGQQAEELVEENDALKMTVHRLNAELSRYQTKFRPLSPAEHRDLKGLPMEGPPPPWLLDMKYLSPLLLAYEDRIKEKENLNIQYEEIMKTFKAQVEELVKENENLHNKLKNDLITTTEWEQLQAQAKLVLKENNMLIQQIEIQQQKEKESNKQHIKKAATLTKQILALENKNQSQEEKLTEYQKQVEALRSACEELKTKENSKIPAEEHFSLVNDLKSRLQQEQEKRRCEVESLSRQLAELQVQNKQLLLERNNFKADRKILEAEMEMTQKTNRQLQKKIDFLKLQLKEAMQKELTAHYHLRNLISLVEKMAQECDNLFVLSKCLENENHDVLKKIVEGSQRLGKLEEKVKRYKKKATEKLECINLKMTEQEKDFEGKTAQYQQEMKHLQNLLQDKQQTLEEVLQQKRDIEEEREFIWQSTSKENRRIKELLQISLHRDQQGMECCCSSEPDESAGISLKALTNRHDFSYCEVKPSSRTTNETQEMSGIKAKVCSHLIHGTEPRA